MDFISKIRYLAYSDFSVSDYSEDEKNLYYAAKAFLSSDEKQAEDIARKIYLSDTDAEIKNTARHLLFCYLVYQNRFDELSQFNIPNNPEEEMAISIRNNNAIAKLTDNSDCLELIQHPFEMIFITVKINSVDVVMLFDTGCQLTTITETTANKCGITASENASDSVNAVGDNISVYIAPMKNLSVGESVFSNGTCTVVPDSMTTFGDITVDGVLGWETISKLKWEIDFKQKKVTVSAPKYADLIRNMVYDHFPMVTVNMEGKQMIMGLDTGANHTKLGAVLSEFFDECEEETLTAYGAGSSREERTYIIPRVIFNIGNGSVQLENVSLLADHEYSHSKFFVTPGILGIDIADDKIMTIDWFNRHFSIEIGNHTE